MNGLIIKFFKKPCLSQDKVIKYKRKMVLTPSKFKEAIMAAKTRDHLTDQLFKAILSLKDEAQCSNFFEDICTISELKSMAQRLEVARMLDEGRIYEEIVEKTGASTATISRVKRCLVYGADGYNSVMPILKKEEKQDAK